MSPQTVPSDDFPTRDTTTIPPATRTTPQRTPAHTIPAGCSASPYIETPNTALDRPWRWQTARYPPQTAPSARHNCDESAPASPPSAADNPAAESHESPPPESRTARPLPTLPVRPR